MKALAILAAVALAWASPAVPQTQPAATVAAVPVDSIARAKFPKSDPELVDKVAFVNWVVNHAMTYTDDQSHYGVPEKWVMLPDDAKGDCEDFALSKMEILRRAGWPVVAYARIRSVVVGTKAKGHGILELLMPSGEHAFLDNRFDHPMTRKELEARGYKFFDW